MIVGSTAIFGGTSIRHANRRKWLRSMGEVCY